MANTTTGNISVTISPIQILAASPDRKAAIIHNISTSKVYIGPTDAITILNTIFIGPGEKFAVGDFHERWNSTIFGIVASGTADVRFWEWGQ